jgi:redox-sensitive bicupin YhaK (pirin superfamily)
MATTQTTSPTIRLRRSADRGFEDFGWTDNWMTFSFGEYRDPAWMSFGPLRVLVENHIQPRKGFPSHSHRDVEIVTYVSAGTLTHEDSHGHRAGVRAGEMQHISAGRGMVHSERNVHDEVEHNLQIWFVPERRGTDFAYHQLGFSREDRMGRFRLYASPDGRDGSMPINADARIHAGLFRPGDHDTYDLDAGRGVWVQVVHGRLEVAGVALEEGDGVGITDASRLDFDFGADSEVVLFDVGMDRIADG